MSTVLSLTVSEIAYRISIRGGP